MNLQQYLLKGILFFIFPNPQNTFEFLILAVVYLSIAGQVLIVVRSIWKLLIFIFFKTIAASRIKAFSVSNPTGGKRLLILGDSTAVGAGARVPADTLAGRFAHDFPEADIVNLGMNGARTKEVLRSISAVVGQHFDLVIISVGGNDIWHLTSLRKLEQQLRALLQSVKPIAKGPIVLLLYSNVGSRIFPPFIRRLMKRRAGKLQDLFRFVANEEGIPCIDLFSKEEDNPFVHNPQRFFSHDGMHPSSEGYGLWYNRLWRLLVARGYTF